MSEGMPIHGIYNSFLSIQTQPFDDILKSNDKKGLLIIQTLMKLQSSQVKAFKIKNGTPIVTTVNKQT